MVGLALDRKVSNFFRSRYLANWFASGKVLDLFSTNGVIVIWYE